MITASVVGATGYTGAVLTDILASHPDVRLKALTSKSYVGRSVSEVFPHLRVEGVYAQYSLEAVAGSNVVFVCYPHGEAHEVVAVLVDSECRVVDLSADFRLTDPHAYADWYGFVHPRPDLVAAAVFGLPELHRSRIARARLVANPGCYPTGMLMGLLPIAEEIDPAKFRPSDTPISYADPAKFKRQTGWEPRISFEQTCVDILNDWRARIK